MTTELLRDHTGTLHLYSDGRPVLGTKVTGMQTVGDDLCAVVVVPLKQAVIGEMRNVVPLVRPVRDVA